MLEVHQKDSTICHIFTSFPSVSKCGWTQLIVFHIMLYHIIWKTILYLVNGHWNAIKIIYKCNKMFKMQVEPQAAGKWTFSWVSLTFSLGCNWFLQGAKLLELNISRTSSARWSNQVGKIVLASCQFTWHPASRQ